MSRKQLPKKVHDAITRLCGQGDRLVKKGEQDAAYEKYRQAWDLVPEDKHNWEASTWILGAVGEILFRRHKFDEALNRFLRAMQCPNGLGNPYIHLRIGQSMYELGDMEAAGDNLARAYMAAGDEIFEDEDPKYLTYLQSILLPPVSPKGPRKGRKG